MHVFQTFCAVVVGYAVAVAVHESAIRWWRRRSRPRCEICGAPATAHWMSATVDDGTVSEQHMIDLCDMHMAEQIESKIREMED